MQNKKRPGLPEAFLFSDGKAKPCRFNGIAGFPLQIKAAASKLAGGFNFLYVFQISYSNVMLPFRGMETTLSTISPKSL